KSAIAKSPAVVIFMFSDAGGIEAANAAVAAKDESLMAFMKGVSLVSIISFAGWGLGYVGQPHILVRFMAAKSVRGMGGARRISISWMILCLLGAVLIGLYGNAFAARHPEISIANPEQIFIIVTQTLFSPWIAGILLSAILAAIMSTLSCQLLVASTTLTADFYRRLIRPSASQGELVWVGRLMLLLVAAIAFAIATDPTSGILKLVSYAWAGFGASFGPAVVFSLFWRRMNLAGCLTGMVVGAATVILWEHWAFLGLYSLVPGFIFSSAAIVAVSLLTSRKDGCAELFDGLEKEFWEEVKDR
ncbi:MAG: sodium:proline symporter, partial [Succinivibrio sp.]